MSEALIVRRGGSGGGTANLFALIDTTYPEGSTCVCKNTASGKTLKAGDITGKWLFIIPEAGSWIVTSSNSSTGESSSVSVNVTTQNTVYSVSLSYTVHLIDAGTIASGYVFNGATQNSGNYSIVAEAANTKVGYVTPAFGVATLNQISVTLQTVGGQTAQFHYGISATSAPTSSGDFVALYSVTGQKDKTTVTIDISAITDATQYYFCVFAQAGVANPVTAYVYDVNYT